MAGRSLRAKTDDDAHADACGKNPVACILSWAALRIFASKIGGRCAAGCLPLSKTVNLRKDLITPCLPFKWAAPMVAALVP